MSSKSFLKLCFVLLLQKLKISGASLDGVQERLVDSALRQARLGGVELTGSTKERFNEIRLRLASIATQFRYSTTALLEIKVVWPMFTDSFCF